MVVVVHLHRADPATDPRRFTAKNNVHTGYVNIISNTDMRYINKLSFSSLIFLNITKKPFMRSDGTGRGKGGWGES